MVNSIQSNINPVQMFSALNAFKATSPVQDTANIVEPSNGIEINDSNILENHDINEIKEFAKIAGEDNLSNDDIQYGVTYGRSVIADYMI